MNNAKDKLKEMKIQNGYISIEIKKDTNINIYIKDNGGGIPENVINNIFEPYFTTKFKSKGTGLGLYMSKMIIENNMNGKLLVKNHEKGAMFTISLTKNGT
jgi:signal transduction histidine kinase